MAKRIGLTDEIKSKILKEYETTQNLLEIARRVGLENQQIYSYARTLGLKAKRSNHVWVDELHVRCSKCPKVLLFTDLEMIRPNSDNPSRISYCRDCRTKQGIAKNNSSLNHYLANRIRGIRTRAKLQNIPFEITVTMLENQYEKQEGKCFYTDIALGISSDKEIEGNDIQHRLSVDKIIPELGYVENNIVLCTVRANGIKGALSLDQMKEWLPLWHQRIQKIPKT